MSNENFVSWDEDKAYSLTSGGLIDTILKKLKLFNKERPNHSKWAIVVGLITWLPLLVITLIEGTFSGETVALSFSEDFVVHIRLLLVLPFLVLIEKLIDSTFDNYMNSTRRLIPQNEEKEFTKLTIQVDKLSNSWMPELLFLCIIYGLYLASWDDLEIGRSRWNLEEGGRSFDTAGLYYFIVCIPMYQFLAGRWIWRWILWGYSVIRISRFNLKVEASHADQMAGLEFMSLVPMVFCILSLAFAATFSAIIAESVVYYNVKLQAYYYSILFFVISIPLLVHLPLLSLIPILIKAKANAMNKFSSLIQYHNNLYSTKWMEGQLPANENILGSLDNSSMADINGSYQQAVKEMHIVPIERNSFLSLIVLLLIPFVPLLFTIYSFKDLINQLLKIVAG